MSSQQAQQADSSPKNGAPLATSKAPPTLAELYAGPRAAPLPGAIVVLHAGDVRRDKALDSRGGDDKKASSGDETVPMPEDLALGSDAVVTPPHVARQADGGYVLVYGNRRLDAFVGAHGKTAPLVFTVDALEDNADNRGALMAISLAENVKRKRMRPHQLAQYLLDIKTKTKLSLGGIAEATGLSKGYISNLCTFREKVHPDLWLRYKAGDEEMLGAGFESLLRIVRKKTLDEQPGAWAAYLAAKESEEEDGGDEGDGAEVDEGKGSGSGGFSTRKGAEVNTVIGQLRKYGIKHPTNNRTLRWDAESGNDFLLGILHAMGWFLKRDKGQSAKYNILEVAETFTTDKAEWKEYVKQIEADEAK